MVKIKEDKRSITSADNGKLGGRPPGTYGDVYRYGQAVKLYIAEQVNLNMDKLIKAMLKKAYNGDVTAFTALMDRAHGKPAQAVEMTGKDGNPIVFMPLELIQKHALQVASKVVEFDEVNGQKETKTSNNGSVEPLEVPMS